MSDSVFFIFLFVFIF